MSIRTYSCAGGLGFSELNIAILTASAALFLIPLSLLIVPKVGIDLPLDYMLPQLLMIVFLLQMERKLGALQVML